MRLYLRLTIGAGAGLNGVPAAGSNKPLQNPGQNAWKNQLSPGDSTGSAGGGSARKDLPPVSVPARSLAAMAASILMSTGISGDLVPSDRLPGSKGGKAWLRAPELCYA